MATDSRVVALVAVFAAGTLVGAAAAYSHLRSEPAAPVAAAQTRPPPSVALPPPGSGIVSVALSNGNRDLRGSGIAIAGHDIVVITLSGFQPATSASWRGAEGRRRNLGDAVAWDFDLGIAIFDVGDASRDGLKLSADDGSLFLGLDVSIVSADGIRDGYVDSSAIAMTGGGYKYDIATGIAGNLSNSALVGPGTRMLLGMAIAAASGPSTRVQAIDAGALRNLIAMRERVTPLSIAALSDAWRQSFVGLATTLQAEQAAGRWEGVVHAADAIARHHPERVDADVVASAVNAYVRWSESYLEHGAITRAMSVVRRGERRWGRNALLSLVLARALVQNGDRTEAIRSLQQFLEQDSGAGDAGSKGLLREQLRKLVVSEATDAAVSPAQAIGLLQDALRGDDYAAYHRYLGERYFEQQRYFEAERSLRRAVELDPRYRSDLNTAIAKSRQRRSTAGLIEVPLQSLDSAIYVTVRLNGRRELYQFLLDTGATYSAINMRTLLRLGLQEVLANSATPIQLETANGAVNAGAIRLASIDLSGAVVEQVPVVVLEDLGNIDGLLGLSFLSHFDVEINHGDNKLLLTPR